VKAVAKNLANLTGTDETKIATIGMVKQMTKKIKQLMQKKVNSKIKMQAVVKQMFMIWI
jgi:hypothetical protein